MALAAFGHLAGIAHHLGRRQTVHLEHHGVLRRLHRRGHRLLALLQTQRVRVVADAEEGPAHADAPAAAVPAEPAGTPARRPRPRRSPTPPRRHSEKPGAPARWSVQCPCWPPSSRYRRPPPPARRSSPRPATAGRLRGSAAAPDRARRADAPCGSRRSRRCSRTWPGRRRAPGRRSPAACRRPSGWERPAGRENDRRACRSCATCRPGRPPRARPAGCARRSASSRFCQPGGA